MKIKTIFENGKDELELSGEVTNVSSIRKLLDENYVSIKNIIEKRIINNSKIGMNSEFIITSIEYFLNNEEAFGDKKVLYSLNMPTQSEARQLNRLDYEKLC